MDMAAWHNGMNHMADCLAGPLEKWRAQQALSGSVRAAAYCLVAQVSGKELEGQMTKKMKVLSWFQACYTPHYTVFNLYCSNLKRYVEHYGMFAGT
jgi:hypothetical protein